MFVFAAAMKNTLCKEMDTIQVEDQSGDTAVGDSSIDMAQVRRNTGTVVDRAL